jgi:hypothetical protein
MSSEMPADNDILFASLAKVRGNSRSAPEGLLALTKDRQVVFIADGSVIYDWPAGEIAMVQSPWYVVGQAFRFQLGGQRYWVSFSQLSSMARTGTLRRGAALAGAVAGFAGSLRLASAVGGMMEISSARGLCSDWKAVLAAADESGAPSQ